MESQPPACTPRVEIRVALEDGEGDVRFAEILCQKQAADSGSDDDGPLILVGAGWACHLRSLPSDIVFL